MTDEETNGLRGRKLEKQMVDVMNNLNSISGRLIIDVVGS